MVHTRVIKLEQAQFYICIISVVAIFVVAITLDNMIATKYFSRSFSTKAGDYY